MSDGEPIELHHGEAIKLYRKKNRITQEQLAKEIGISRYTLIKLEKNENTKHSVFTIGKIEDYFKSKNFDLKKEIE